MGVMLAAGWPNEEGVRGQLVGSEIWACVFGCACVCPPGEGGGKDLVMSCAPLVEWGGAFRERDNRRGSSAVVGIVV